MSKSQTYSFLSAFCCASPVRQPVCSCVWLSDRVVKQKSSHCASALCNTW